MTQIPSSLRTITHGRLFASNAIEAQQPLDQFQKLRFQTCLFDDKANLARILFEASVFIIGATSMSRERLNPPGLFKHPYFTRILKVKNPATVIFMAGHTPADENYQPVHQGDLRGQYKAILDALTFQLKEAGATWDDVVFRRMYAIDVPAFMEIVRDPSFPLPWHPDRPSPSTLIGVTALSNPGFLLEIEIVAMVDG